jgi:hypothetical protein
MGLESAGYEPLPSGNKNRTALSLFALLECRPGGIESAEQIDVNDSLKAVGAQGASGLLWAKQF